MMPDDCISTKTDEELRCFPRMDMRPREASEIELLEGKLLTLAAQVDEACQRIRALEERFQTWLELVYRGNIPEVLRFRQLPLPLEDGS